MDIATKDRLALRITRAAFSLIAIAFVVSSWVSPPANAETLNQVLDKPVNQNQEYLSSGKQANPIVGVDLYIEIPSQRLVFHHTMSVPVGYTVSQVLEAAYPVKHGLVCCDASDIWSVNGISVDPTKEKWWIIRVNGNRQNYSARSKVSNNDIVELVYEEGAGYPPGHVRLEDWVAGAKHGKN